MNIGQIIIISIGLIAGAITLYLLFENKPQHDK